MNTVRCGFDGIPTVWFGAVLRNRESYGAVRCGLQILEVLRCGSVRFSDVVNPTVRFGYFLCPTVRFGAVFRYRKTYGAMRCGALFKRAKILRCGAVRCGAVRLTAPNRTAPIGKISP